MSDLTHAKVGASSAGRPRLSVSKLTALSVSLLALAVVMALALGLRLYNVNWDQDSHLHPDERHLTLTANALELPSTVGEYFATDSSPLNPYNRETGSFVYGSFPLVLTKVVAVTLDYDDYDHIVLVGRYLSALFDAATVFLVFLIGRRIFGFRAGLIAALLYATAPLAIQHAHFFVVDPFLVFFITAALFFAIRIAQLGKRQDYILAGLALGLGTASKLTALGFLPILFLAAGVHAWPVVSGFLKQPRLPSQDAAPVRVAGKAISGLALAMLVAFLAFRIAQPYAFAQPDTGNPLSFVALSDQWVSDQENQTRLLGGEVSFPPSVQWIDRESYIYPLRQMIEVGMGPAFGILGWLAFAYAAYRVLRFKDPRQILLVAFVLVYFGFMGRQFSLYLRYFLPLYPVLAVLAGFALLEFVAVIGRLGQRLSVPGFTVGGRVAAVLLVGLAMLPGLAYMSIYSNAVTRVEASQWIYDTLPAGSAIASEHWDDSLPLRLAGSPDKQFTNLSLPLYELDTEAKIDSVINLLDQADFVVLSSNRLLNSIPRNPSNYPVTSRYYDLLLAEELGFSLARRFDSPPSLFGVNFPDSQREESWSSYDHPRVLIFEKKVDFSRERLEDLLGLGPFAGFGLNPRLADFNGLLLSADDLETQRLGGTWFDIFSDSGIVASHPTIIWLLAIEIAALAVTPLTMLLFRRLPDRGYLLSKPLGLLLLAYPVWLLVSLKLVHFNQGTILLVLAALLIAGGLILYRWGSELEKFIKANWKLILFSEALFLAAFFVFWVIRLQNPDLWHPFRGGEKPMDLAYLTAVARSTTLPPYDPWFAGGYINYYYLGQFFTATLLKLTTIQPAIGYNLAVPTFFAFTFAGAFSVAYNLAAIGRRHLRRGPGLRRLPRWSLYMAGLFGALFVAVAGNLDGVGQMAQRLSEVSSWHLNTNLPLVDSAVNSVGGIWQVLFRGAELQSFDFWGPSRMMPPTISITEFPNFSFLFADLHAHMMALPFEVLVVGLCAALAVGPRGDRNSFQEWGVVVLLALVVGSLRWINSWDYPPYLLMGLASVVIGERRLEDGAAAASWRIILKAALLVGLSFIFFQPFLASYLTPVSGLDSTPETTPPQQYLAHFGVFAAVIGLWLIYLLARTWRSSVGGFAGLFRSPEDQPASRRQFARQLWVSVAVGVFGVVVISAAGLASRGHGLLAVLLPALVLVTYLAIREFRLQRPDGGLRLFLLMLVGLGLGLSMGVELVRINGDIQRMNTVFKFYLHVWVVYALVASFASWHLLLVLWRPTKTRSLFGGLLRSVGRVSFAVLLIAAMSYPVLATSVRIDDRFVELSPTLDGEAFMQVATYNDRDGEINLSEDLAGIEWLRRNVQGTPTIVEGRTDLYRWGSRISIHTGLPTVLGWDWHQIQQRGELSSQVGVRAQQVDAFYSDPNVDQALAFLRQYSVEYVIVGKLEQLYYPAEGLTKFDSGLNGALEMVYASADLTIYWVRPSAGQSLASP